MKHTAHSGMAPSSIPTPSMVVLTLVGMENSKAVPMELEAATFDMTLWIIVTKFTMSLRQLFIRAFAMAKRTNTFTAVSGFLSSAKLPQVFITPTVKNRTRRAVPMAPKAPFMVVMTFQMAPPLND